MNKPTKITTLTSREFNQDTGGAKRAAEKGPVFITDRGEVAYVLMNIGEYRRLSGPRRSLADMLSHPKSAHIEFDPPKANIKLKPVDFD